MFLSVQHRKDLGLPSEPEHESPPTVLPNGVTNTKRQRIAKLRKKDTPQSFEFNSPKEEALLKYLETFATAFQRLYPTRNKLFLAPYNECGIPKFVTTTLRPTKLPFLDTYYASKCATFAAGYLTFEPTEFALENPVYLPSPKAVVKWQVADSFDAANVLASLLIGAGYRALVVKGYAPKWITWGDQSKQECPAVIQSGEDEAKESKTGYQSAKKGSKNGNNNDDEELLYPITRPSVGVSAYETMMAERAKAAALALERKEAELLEEEEVPEEQDELEGKRVHAWVMIVPNQRKDVKEYTMVEATTGVMYTLDSSPYLGVEQIWDQHNLFVNMQSSTAPCRDLHWNFDEPNSASWLPLFRTQAAEQVNSDDEDEDEEEQPASGPSSPRSGGATPRILSPRVGSSIGSPRGEGTGSNNPASAAGSVNGSNGNSPAASVGTSNALGIGADGESVLALEGVDVPDAAEVLPPSWCPFLEIPASAFNLKYGGKKHEKVVLYKRAKHEMFPKHLHKEGLTSRVTIYDDDEYTIPVETREEFAARTDKLTSRVRKPMEGLTISYFDPGRPRKLRELHEVMGRSVTMLFDWEARLDGLETRKETFGETLTEEYRGRSDKLVHRTVAMIADESDGAGAAPAATSTRDTGKKAGAGGDASKDDAKGKGSSGQGGPNGGSDSGSNSSSGKGNNGKSGGAGSSSAQSSSASSGGPSSSSHPFTIPGGPSGDFLIESMTQEFERDESKEAEKDVAKRVFVLLPQHKQKVVEYAHYGKNRILQQSTEFLKTNAPQSALNNLSSSNSSSAAGAHGRSSGRAGGSSFGRNQRGDSKFSQSYGENSGGAGGAGGEFGQEHMSAEFLRVLQAERECYLSVRDSKRETQLILKARQDEEANIQVKKSIFEEVRSREGKKKTDEAEEQEEETTVESDYLTPFLPKGVKVAPAAGTAAAQAAQAVAGAPGSDPEKDGVQLSKDQAQKVAENCLNALKKRLVERASIIQRRLDAENEKLSKRQALFQRSRDASESVDDEYEKFCQEAMFRIQILEKRFQKHEETAFQKYEEMIARLDADPRLAAKNEP